MSWVIIIDNGQIYSDHSHQVVAVCKTDAQASEAVEAFNKWKRTLDQSGVNYCYDSDSESAAELNKSNPCPFSKVGIGYDSNWKLNSSDTVFAVEVPAWAKGRA
jgi:hypothetical protein